MAFVIKVSLSKQKSKKTGVIQRFCTHWSSKNLVALELIENCKSVGVIRRMDWT